MTFQLDPFQAQAIAEIEQHHSVLVSAPTGSGKTVIAEAAIDKALRHGEAAIYTAPIKALSNQKYRDFSARYGEQVGIVTGDVSIRPQAPILIMTTEIYRSSLFESLDRIKKVGWVIFDEVHYLDDVERGTVWEEALLFTPPTIHILALSATVPNIDELAEWIRSIHHRSLTVIRETHRPVPLHFTFQCQGQIMHNMKRLRHEGYRNRLNWRLTSRERRRGVKPTKAKPNRLDHLMHHLIDQHQLPAIYFIFGRRRAEILAHEAMQFNLLTDIERTDIRSLYDSLLNRFDLTREPSASELRPLVEQGIAYHHAGMLPTLKETIEQLFTSRLIKLIFTTETFALGINMPARTVILDELEKFYGKGFRFLTTRDFFQMAGRAGRRGMDQEGFVYARVQPHYIPYPEVERILYGRPEPIRSQLNTTYATLLNLYRDVGRKLLDIYPRSFHHFQSREQRRQKGAQLIEAKLGLLEELGYIHGATLTPKGDFAASLFGFELMLSEIHAEGVLDELNEVQLNVLLSALVFEPRKGDRLPKVPRDVDLLRAALERFARMIHKKEARFRVAPYTKPPHFHLATALAAWTQGETFDTLARLTSVDEGELVRYIRMVIQLLRELLHAPHISDRLAATARSARDAINRGVVDAERQLRA